MSITKIAAQDYFEDLTAIARSVDDPGLARQLRMLAELYRYAISIGGGYATIARAINNLKEMYDDGNDSDIGSILNGMLQILTKEAGGAQALAGKDNPIFVERLMQLKSDIESRSEENDDTYENYQDEINTPGANNENESDLSEYGLGGDTETVSPAALGFGNKEDPKANRGWHTVGPSNLYKNWKEYYENEVNAYNIQLAQTDDPDVKNAFNELVKLIPQVSNLVEKRTQLTDQIRVAPDDALSRKLAIIKTTLKSLKEKIVTLKKSIRSIQLKKNESFLQEQVNDAIQKKDLKAKELAEQKLALNKLTQSSDVYKTKERNLRLRLIENMSGGNFPGTDTLAKEKYKIQLAEQERVKKDVYDRKLTEERGKQQGRNVTPDYEPTRGGGRVPMERLPEESRVDFDKAAFAALLKKLRDDNNTAISDARKYIMRANERGNPAFKPFVDKISATIRKGDKVAQYAAIEELKREIANKLKDSSINGYIQSIRLAPHFKNIEERLYTLVKGEKGKPEKMDSAGNLVQANITESDMQNISLLLNDINRLTNLYARYYQNAGGLKVQTQPYAFFKNVILALKKIESHLVTQLHAKRPEKKILGPKTDYKQIPDLEDQKKKLSHNKRVVLLSLARRQKDRELAEQKGREQARESIPTYAPQRGGGRVPMERLPYEQQPDLELASFKGLIHQFQDDFNTCFTVNKQLITVAKQNGNPQLKPFVDALAKAIVKNDSKAKYEAIKLLKQATEQYLEQKLKKIIKITRMIPHFRKLRDDLNLLSKLQDPVNNSWRLNEDNKLFVGKLLETTARLQKVSQLYYRKENHGLSSTLRDLAKIKAYLEYVYTQGESS